MSDDEAGRGGGRGAETNPWLIPYIEFVNDVRRRFPQEGGVYQRFLEVLAMIPAGLASTSDVRTYLGILFENHPDLLDTLDRLTSDTPPTNDGAAAATGGQRGKVSKRRPKKNTK